jgi:beta-lactamase regulating signal transducer with metallopeptidase domain
MLQHLIDTLTLFSAAASGSLLNAIAQGLVLTAAVAICLRLLPGIKPAARFVVWFSVLFAVLCLPLIPELKNNLGSPLSSNTASFYLDFRWSVLILGLWGALSLLRAIKLVKSVFELRRIASSATPLPASSQDPQLLKAGLRSAEVCTSSVVDRPSVVGFLHPRILLPEDLISKLSDQQLEQILLHEMEHLRRRDDWTNLFQKIAVILFPFGSSAVSASNGSLHATTAFSISPRRVKPTQPASLISPSTPWSAGESLSHSVPGKNNRSSLAESIAFSANPRAP